MGRSTNAAKPDQGSGYDDEDDRQLIDHRIQRDGPRIISLYGDVSENMIANTIHHMLVLAQLNTSPIQMVVSTYGGSVDEMFSIYDVMKLLSAPVYTIALGKVMSAGVLLLAAGKKGNRVIGRSARIMIHPISGGAMGNIFQVENESGEMKRQQSQMVAALVRETRMTKKVIDDIMKQGQDHYLTPQKAIEYGIADRIVGDLND